MGPHQRFTRWKRPGHGSLSGGLNFGRRIISSQTPGKIKMRWVEQKRKGIEGFLVSISLAT